MMQAPLVIGLDFGTDSVRGLLIEPQAGKVISRATAQYSRWQKGLYCQSAKSQYRQHPLDYIEGIDAVFVELLKDLSPQAIQAIAAIGTSTTGSTPIALDESLQPLCFKPGFEENPNAMFVLWKDHTATCEAEQINSLAKSWPVDYTLYSGELYSSEWYWSKILHIHKSDAAVCSKAYTWVEQSDWVAMHLAGVGHIDQIKRNRCAAGHKAMWHAAHGGFPSADFLSALHPSLGPLRHRLPKHTYTSDHVMGFISDYYVHKFGFSNSLVISVGGLDAHHDAIGAGINSKSLVKVIGTSTCDMLVMDASKQVPLIKGICGQVDGSIIPGMVGFEAGQSAFGDIYQWFAKLLVDSVMHLDLPGIAANQQHLLEARVLESLSQRASGLTLSKDDLVFTDYHNGRRTPDADFRVQDAAYGFTLASGAAEIFKALVEATAFGSKVILERFLSAGVCVENIIATGGIAMKSSYIMQVLADVLAKDIQVVSSQSTSALGAAIVASRVSGAYESIQQAQEVLAAKVVKTYHPIAKNVKNYDYLYGQYRKLSEIKF